MVNSHVVRSIFLLFLPRIICYGSENLLFLIKCKQCLIRRNKLKEQKWRDIIIFLCRLITLIFLAVVLFLFNPYPTAFPYGNGMVLHFYQQQESSTTKTVHKVINKGLKTYV